MGAHHNYIGIFFYNILGIFNIYLEECIGGYEYFVIGCKILKGELERLREIRFKISKCDGKISKI